MPLLQNSTMVCGWIGTEWKLWLHKELNEANRSHLSVPHLFQHYLNTSLTYSIFPLNRKLPNKGKGKEEQGQPSAKPARQTNSTTRVNTTLAREHKAEQDLLLAIRKPFIQSYRNTPQDAQNHRVFVTRHWEKNKWKCLFLFCWISCPKNCLHFPYSNASPDSPGDYATDSPSKEVTKGAK